MITEEEILHLKNAMISYIRDDQPSIADSLFGEQYFDRLAEFGNVLIEHGTFEKARVLAHLIRIACTDYYLSDQQIPRKAIMEPSIASSNDAKEYIDNFTDWNWELLGEHKNTHDNDEELNAFIIPKELTLLEIAQIELTKDNPEPFQQLLIKANAMVLRTYEEYQLAQTQLNLDKEQLKHAKELEISEITQIVQKAQKRLDETFDELSLARTNYQSIYSLYNDHMMEKNPLNKKIFTYGSDTLTPKDDESSLKPKVIGVTSKKNALLSHEEILDSDEVIEAFSTLVYLTQAHNKEFGVIISYNPDTRQFGLEFRQGAEHSVALADPNLSSEGFINVALFHAHPTLFHTTESTHRKTNDKLTPSDSDLEIADQEGVICMVGSPYTYTSKVQSKIEGLGREAYHERYHSSQELTDTQTPGIGSVFVYGVERHKKSIDLGKYIGARGTKSNFESATTLFKKRDTIAQHRHYPVKWPGYNERDGINAVMAGSFQNQHIQFTTGIDARPTHD
jgi:hypothetical protein